MSWYAIHDCPPEGERPPCIQIARVDAQRFNSSGHGIFVAVNRFNGPRRIANISHVRAWVVEIDGASKREQVARVERSPVIPSIVVESKRSLHLWWLAENATPETWNSIVRDRLKPFFGADPAATLLTQLLRVPNYLHLKDPEDPFPVREIHRIDVRYTERQMLESFPDIGSSERERKAKERARRAAARTAQALNRTDDFWARVASLDCRYALERLSRHALVNGEEYDFKPCRNGTQTIVVDGKPTACWVDEQGRIGSLKSGGPTIAQWLKWFGASYSDVAKGLKEVFPELAA